MRIKHRFSTAMYNEYYTILEINARLSEAGLPIRATGGYKAIRWQSPERKTKMPQCIPLAKARKVIEQNIGEFIPFLSDCMSTSVNRIIQSI